jgi:outer membrane protein assembly factor BamB
VTSGAVPAGDTVVMGSRSCWLTALHQSDGSPVWSRFNWFSWVESTGVVIDGTHYVGSSDLPAVRALSANTGALLCETDVLGFSWGMHCAEPDAAETFIAWMREHSNRKPSLAGSP